MTRDLPHGFKLVSIQALYDSSSYLAQNQNIILLGPTGVGKTGLATSFLTHAIHQGKTGRYILFAQLITELYQSIADHTQAKILKHYLSYDLLQLGMRNRAGNLTSLHEDREMDRLVVSRDDLGNS